MSVKIGSLFAGIGGFELGLERAIPGAETIWQVEQDAFCQSILKKHWPHAQIFDDVCAVGAHNLPPVDILCGGFPCQDISLAGKGEGLNGKKSGLWFEMRRIISELRPSIIILENVAAITFRGLPTVLGELSKLGYDAEWCIISARDFGAPHLRKRWFCVAYANSERPNKAKYGWTTQAHNIQSNILNGRQTQQIPNTDGTFSKRAKLSERKKKAYKNTSKSISQTWRKGYSGAKICRVDDGVSRKLDKARLKALGNAIVPQCSQWIGEQVLASGLLDGLIQCKYNEASK